MYTGVGFIYATTPNNYLAAVSDGLVVCRRSNVQYLCSKLNNASSKASLGDRPTNLGLLD